MIYFPFIQPEKAFRRAVRPTYRNLLGQHVMATRKEMDVYHEIVYTYDPFPISARQMRIIDHHCASMDGGTYPFKVVDWGGPRVVTAIDGKGYITLNTIQDLSTDTGSGGNRICLWANTGDYGNDSSVSARVLTDTTQAWTTNQWQNHQIMDANGHVFAVASNTGNTVTVSGISVASLDSGAYDIFRYEDFLVTGIDTAQRRVTVNASIVMSYSAWQQFVLPVYTCHYAQDTLDFEPDGFLREATDNYGPLYTGEILFVQKGTG